MLCKHYVDSQLDGVGTHVGWPYVMHTQPAVFELLVH